jgi:hypothetical protein
MRAGDTLSINFTGVQSVFMGPDSKSSQFLPYERAIYVNSSVPIFPVSAIDDSANMITSFNFTLA